MPDGIGATEVIDEATASGVVGVVCVGTDLGASRQAVDLVNTIRATRSGFGAWATAGLHPHEASEGLGVVNQIEGLIAESESSDPGLVVAVGECGLDYHYDHSPRPEQRVAFEAQVELTPHEIALIFGHEQLTYTQLNQQANRVAHALLSQGVRVEECVGIYAERSVEMVVGMLAVLKAGGAYVPLDPSYPPERLTFMSNDSSLAAVLTTTRFVRQLPTSNASVILLDQDLPQFDENAGLHRKCVTVRRTGLDQGVHERQSLLVTFRPQILLQ